MPWPLLIKKHFKIERCARFSFRIFFVLCQAVHRRGNTVVQRHKLFFVLLNEARYLHWLIQDGKLPAVLNGKKAKVTKQCV